jgi:homoserine O-succinyltransferase/O-acetyltransferase
MLQALEIAESGRTQAVPETQPLVVALVNNMPDPALRTTEQQFRALLSSGTTNPEVVLKLFSLPEISRSEAAQSQLMQYYQPISALFESKIDGLIVTGAEPKACRLTDEAYWGSLTQLIDWARHNTVSAIWSCLAAHAAVYHLDGINRCTFERKLVGIFDCEMVDSHGLLSGLPQKWVVPHSRHNGLPESLLRSGGYHLLSWSPDAGPDVFIKQCGSLFLFLQGHPEYYVDGLFREYRRDVMRYLAGEQASYPEPPHQYFDRHTMDRLEAFRLMAERCRDIGIMREFPTDISVSLQVIPRWNDIARRLLRNWISYLCISRGSDPRVRDTAGASSLT